MASLSDKNSAMFEAHIEIVAEVGATKLEIGKLLKVGRGAVIELDRNMASNVDLTINDRLFATGVLESSGDVFSVRIHEIFP